MNEPTFLVVDLFAGFGGVTEGFEDAKLDGQRVAVVIVGINHDQKAIDSFKMNHTEAVCFTEDIRTVSMAKVLVVVREFQKKYPNAYLVLWASLECTNHSKAKGGLPRDADSRTLAHDLFRYQEALDPDFIKIENVVEFMAWGPLDENGKPVSRKNGREWVRWRNEMCSKGYHDEWKELNSANFGAYTSRNRLFGCFAKHGLPIIWPEATHAKKLKPGMFGSLKPWKAVKDVLNFDDEGVSIFNRETNMDLRPQDRKPLVDKTLERIYAGLIKYVAGGEKAFFTKYMGNDAKTGINNGKSLEEPSPVIATSNRLGLVQPNFLTQRNSGNPNGKVFSTDGPARTITTTGGNQELVQAAFIAKHYSGKPEGKVIPVTGPAGTKTCSDGQALVQSSFLYKYYGTGANVQSVEKPAGTLTTKDRMVKVDSCFLDKQYSGDENHQSIHVPAGTITTNPKLNLVQTTFLDRQFSNGKRNQSVDEPHGALTTVPKSNLVTADQFLVNQNYDNGPKSIEDPLGVITANRKHFYLVNPQYSWPTSSVNDPAFTLIARMDKAPPYLVQLASGEIAIEVYESDSPIMRKIKQFMALYGIADIKMRMLRVLELLKIQGFPETYRMAGNQSDHKKFIGNSVVPHVVQAWAEAMAKRLRSFDLKVWRNTRKLLKKAA